MTDAAERRPRAVFVVPNPSIDRLYEVERLAVGSIHRPELVAVRPGGKGLNAARAAALLGGRVTAIGIVGGHAGDWLMDQLAVRGLEVHMARTSRESRTCVSILDRSSGALTEVYEPGEAIEPGAWEALEELVTRELEDGDVGALAVSGSLPPGAPGDGYARIAKIATRWAIPVLADVYGPALAAILPEHPAIVKVNASEAATVAGLSVADAHSAISAARRLRDRGATAVIITLGLAGAVIVDATTAVRLLPPEVRGAYPVGSGDAFLAGLTVAFVTGVPLVEAARYGMAAGIANALLPGAGDLDPAVAQQLAAAVSVERL